MKTTKKNNKKGFTLTELLVAIGIIGILAAVSAILITSYTKRLDQLQQDNYAKQVFYASQNQMTELVASGTWETLKKQNDPDSSDSEDFWGVVISENDWPADYEYELSQSGLTEKTGLTENLKTNSLGNLRVISITVDSTGETQGSLNQDSLIGYLLPFGSIDETTRTEGQFFIEYNIETAAVYAVWYSAHTEKTDYLTYKYDICDDLNDNGRPRGAVSGGAAALTDDAALTNRMMHNNEGGKRVSVGYYGTSFSSDIEVEQLSDITAEIINGEELQLKVTDPNIGKDCILSVTIQGRTSKNKATFLIEKDSSGYYSLTDHGDFPSGGTTKKRNVKREEISGTYVYTIVLDSITNPSDTEIFTPEYNLHFYSMCSINNGTTDGVIPGENIDVTASCVPQYGIAVPSTDTVSTNGLFWLVNETKAASDKITAEAEITQLRHFENLSGAISGLTTVASADYVVTSAKFLNDVTFDNTPSADAQTSVGSEASMYNVQNVLRKDYTKYYITDYQGNTSQFFKKGSFIPINNAAIKKIDGNEQHVLNVVINQKENTEPQNVGLFGTLSGDIEYLGYVSYPSADRKCLVSGQNIVGSIAGIFKNGTCEGCYANVKVTGLNAVNESGSISSVSIGGLFGKTVNATITNCYVGGFTENGAYEITDPNISY